MKPKNTILVIDDEPATLKVMQANLSREGFAVITALDGAAALELLEKERIDVIIADYMMPNLDGLTLLERLREQGIDIPTIIITAHGSIEHAVKAMQLGALTYLTKPINYDELLLVLNRCLEQTALKQEIHRLRQEVELRYSFSNIIGKSHKMQEIFELIEDLANTDATILIYGETGTGKELIAKAIHYNSSRRDGPFVRVNCAALPENLLESELFGHERGAFTGAIKTRIGRFEEADSGTIFLDEVGDIPMATQAKLLRVLQEKTFERLGSNQSIQVDVRVISATNKDLQEAISRGEFREDLFYRLNVVVIHVPPLRDRMDDLPLLAVHFTRLYAEKFKKDIECITPEAIQTLFNYRWPGNIRELENVIERAVIIEKSEQIQEATIQKCLLPKKNEKEFRYYVYDGVPFKKAKTDLLNRFEKDYLTRLLEKHGGRIVDAAREAQMDYKNFCEKMRRHGLSKWDFKD